MTYPAQLERVAKALAKHLSRWSPYCGGDGKIAGVDLIVYAEHAKALAAAAIAAYPEPSPPPPPKPSEEDDDNFVARQAGISVRLAGDLAEIEIPIDRSSGASFRHFLTDTQMETLRDFIDMYFDGKESRRQHQPSEEAMRRINECLDAVTAGHSPRIDLARLLDRVAADERKANARLLLGTYKYGQKFRPIENLTDAHSAILGRTGCPEETNS